MATEADERPFSKQDMCMSLLSDAYLKKVRPCIDLIDKLRSYGLDQDVSLPSVVVIGDQSTGKSSTLEAISGILLPRGSGIVTRCPLELRLKSRPEESKWKGKISFQKSSGEKVTKEITDPSCVGDEVNKAQDEIAGIRKGISKTLITLDIEAENVPDLTLIDLPGITRVAVEDQEEDIPQQIKELILEYIKKEETIILCVIPANIDIATTEALKLAQEVDKFGERTLGVITKPDLVDKGSENEIIAVVNNHRFKLKKGYTMIKCRGQQDIVDGKSLQHALEAEASFFEDHPVFGKVDKSLVGTQNLAAKLTSELVNQIKKAVPFLRQEVKEKLKETRGEIDSLRAGVPEDETEKKLYLFQLLSKFDSDIDSVVTGNYRNGIMKDVRFITIAVERFEKLRTDIENLLPRNEDTTFIYRIKQDMEGRRGRELPRFLNYSLCETIVRERLQEYKDPCFECLYSIDSLAERVFLFLVDKTFEQFDEVKSDLKVIIDDLRTKSLKMCEESLLLVFATESIVYTQGSNFVREHDIIEKAREETFRWQQTRLKQPTGFVYQGKPILKDEELMFDRILAYLKVATQRISDVIPMMIMHHIIHKLSEDIKLQIRLLGSQPEILKKLEEDPSVSLKRRMLKDKLERLTNAEKELTKF